MTDSADAQDDKPQLYLVTPAAPDLETYPAILARALDAAPVACMRLAMATRDEDAIARMADALREITHARDIALVIDNHALLVERLGLDGVHLTDGGRGIAKLRKSLGEDAIIGAYCGASRHDGLNAGEMGADYVSFGPVGETSLGDGARAEMDLFQWWSEMVEVPVVAEGALSLDLVRRIAPMADFIALGDEIWTAEDPAAALAAYYAALG